MQLEATVDIDTFFGYLEDVPVEYDLIEDPEDQPTVKLRSIIFRPPEYMIPFGVDLETVRRSLERRHEV